MKGNAKREGPAMPALSTEMDKMNVTWPPAP